MPQTPWGLLRKKQMYEETPTIDQKIIELTKVEYVALARALQWPEDLPQWDKDNTPTNMREILGTFATI